MAVRKCPQCLATVPAAATVAYTDGMDCPGCGQRLEVSLASRFMASLGGLLAAALAWRLSTPAGGDFGWVLPVVYAIFAWGAASPLMLMWFADLGVRAPEPQPAAPQDSAGHSHH